MEEINPIQSKENLDMAYIKVLSSAYGLLELEFVGVSDRGVSSHNVILKTPDDRKFFVKRYKEDDAERRECANLIERCVSEHSSVPVALPLETVSGESSVYVEGDMYAVFEYQEHNTEEPSSIVERQRQFFNLAQALGQIHSVSTEHITADMVAIDRWLPREITDRITHLDSIKDTIKAKDSHDEFDQSALRVIDERKKALLELEVSEHVTAEKTFCHGDYHSHNVLFDNDMNVTGVIDWDGCGLSDPYVDFLNTFQMTVIDGDFDNFQELQYEEAKAFVKGYVEAIDFDFDIERLKNAANFLAEVMVGSSWPLDEHYFMDYTKADGYLESEWNRDQNAAKGRTEIVTCITKVLADLEAEKV